MLDKKKVIIYKKMIDELGELCDKKLTEIACFL